MRKIIYSVGCWLGSSWTSRGSKSVTQFFCKMTLYITAALRGRYLNILTAVHCCLIFSYNFPAL